MLPIINVGETPTAFAFGMYCRMKRGCWCFLLVPYMVVVEKKSVIE